MWHSCGKFSLDDLFARAEPHVRNIFRKFDQMVRACGPVHMIPQKTRVVFQVRMRFAGASPRKSYLVCSFILPREIRNTRFQKIEKYGPRSYGHYLPVRSESELDSAVERWLKEAYQVGQQMYVRRLVPSTPG
jgi:hypothetical protein